MSLGQHSAEALSAAWSAGYVVKGDTSISTRSLGASPTVQPRAPLKAARVTCRGKPVWLRGGPLLEPFAKNFVGASCFAQAAVTLTSDAEAASMILLDARHVHKRL